MTVFSAGFLETGIPLTGLSPTGGYLFWTTDTDPSIPSGGTTRPTYGQEWPRGNW